MTFAILTSLITLGVYCVQQFGVTLAVGAETILLVAYLQAVRDGIVDEEEKGFARAVRTVKDFGLFFIILSGGALLANQFLTGQLSSFLSVTVLFKWSLIGIVLFMTFITRGSSLTSGLLQGLAAGTWYALFAVHILAPEAPWVQLGTFYAIWLIGFSVCWTVLVFALRNRKPVPVVAARQTSAIPRAAVVVTPDRVVSKPAQPPTPSIPRLPVAPAVQTIPPPPPPKAPVSVLVSAAAAPPASWLHVMPRTPEELARRRTQTQ